MITLSYLITGAVIVTTFFIGQSVPPSSTEPVVVEIKNIEIKKTEVEVK
jgi:energy-converting hydrogenase Eha subunit E